MFIGSMVCTADITVQVAYIGILVSPTRYGMLVMENQCGQTLQSDAVESAVAFDPIIDEIAT